MKSESDVVHIDIDKLRAPVPADELTTEQHAERIMEQVNIFGEAVRKKLIHHLHMAEQRGRNEL